jgi:hypothetical protein
MEHFEQPDLSTQLPRDMYYQLAHRLRAALPPPVTNSPDDFVRRDNAAIAEAASLLPANAEEASLAAQFVAASAQALDSLALVEQYRTIDPMRADKCNAQAANMMRQARGFRSLLLRVQAARQKREANATTLDKAAWIEHCAIGLLAQGLGRSPPPPIDEPEPPPMPDPQPDEGPAATRPPSGGRTIRDHLPSPRRADPSLPRPAAPVRLRPTLARTGPRHRHRRQPDPASPRQSRRSRRVRANSNRRFAPVHADNARVAPSARVSGHQKRH